MHEDIEPIEDEDYQEYVANALIEILAIKLYEHDLINGARPKLPNMGWQNISNEDRELFRKQARGTAPIGYPRKH